MNGEVRTEIKRKWRVRQLNNNLSNHRSVRNNGSSSFSGNSCHDVREPLRGGSRQGSKRIQKKSVKERLFALRNNAFGSNSANGHVPLGNGSTPGRRVPPSGVALTDTPDNSTTPSRTSRTNDCKSEETVDVTVTIDERNGSRNNDSPTMTTTNKTHAKVAPLVKGIDELHRIADSTHEINVGSKDHINKVGSSSSLDGNKLASSSVFLDVDGHADDTSPPEYEELFPKIKPSTSNSSNIETQV